MIKDLEKKLGEGSEKEMPLQIIEVKGENRIDSDSDDGDEEEEENTKGKGK